jgi:hypothetical protein
MTKENAVEQLTAMTGLPDGVLEALDEELEIVEDGTQNKTGDLLGHAKDSSGGGDAAANETGGTSGGKGDKRRKIVIAEHSRFIKDYGKKK